MTATPPDRIKQELTSLLRKAMETKDSGDMENIFHLIVDKSNQLRQKYGMPTIIDPEAHEVTLKSPTEQLRAAGIGHETVMGHAVYARANSAPEEAKTDQLCLFDQCFAQPEYAGRFRERVMQRVSQNMKADAVVIYPPLLLRATRDEMVGFRVDRQGYLHRSREKSDRNVIFIMFQEGPIIPVVDKGQHERFRTLIQTVYALQGTTEASALEMSLTT